MNIIAISIYIINYLYFDGRAILSWILQLVIYKIIFVLLQTFLLVSYLLCRWAILNYTVHTINLNYTFIFYLVLYFKIDFYKFLQYILVHILEHTNTYMPTIIFISYVGIKIVWDIDSDTSTTKSAPAVLGAEAEIDFNIESSGGIDTGDALDIQVVDIVCK